VKALESNNSGCRATKMAAIPGSTGVSSMDPFNKLHSDTGSLLHEAESKPEFQQEQDEAKQRRMAQVIGDQQLAPMTVNELRIHGAVNTRTNFLDPIFQPLVSDKLNASATVGDVIDGLRIASNKLDALQIFQPQPEVFLTSAQQTDPSTSLFLTRLDLTRS
jgi:outer membrane protein insertion porin family